MGYVEGLRDDYRLVLMLALVWQSPPVASFVRSDGRCAPRPCLFHHHTHSCRFALRYHASSLNLLLSLMLRLCLGKSLFTFQVYMAAYRSVDLDSFLSLSRSNIYPSHGSRVSQFHKFEDSPK